MAKKPSKPRVKPTLQNLQRIFLTGLFIMAPVAISVWVLAILVRFMENLLGPLLRNLLDETYIPGIGFVSLILLILLLGFVASNILGRRFLKNLQQFLEKVPLFNKIYLTVRGISDEILGGEQQRAFKSVVLIPFPSPGIRTVGFITAAPAEAGPGMVGVFVPTVPNITTGFYLIYPESEVQPTTLTIEEGIRLVISAGLSRNSGEKNGKNPPDQG